VADRRKWLDSEKALSRLFDEGVERAAIAVAFAAVEGGTSFIGVRMSAIRCPEIVQGYALSTEVIEDLFEGGIPLRGLVFSLPDGIEVVIPAPCICKASIESTKSAIADAFGNLEDETVDDMIGRTTLEFIFVGWFDEMLRKFMFFFESGPVSFGEDKTAF